MLNALGSLVNLDLASKVNVSYPGELPLRTGKDHQYIGASVFQPTSPFPNCTIRKFHVPMYNCEENTNHPMKLFFSLYFCLVL